MVSKRRGRPPAGPKGQSRATMRQISARIPDDTYAQLKALAVVLQISQADVIGKAVNALEQSLGDAELRLVRLLRKRDGN
jgi:predicted negative regulator of RcsB-dependent stress response